MSWLYEAFRFCTYCGGGLSRAAAPGRMQSCDRCGAVVFHAAKPTASGVVLNEQDEVLLVRRRNRPYHGWWDIPGGFVDFGETPEMAVVRELNEETGLNVRPLQSLGVWQHRYQRREGWDLNLCTFFVVEATGGELQAGDDAAAVAWFRLSELPTRLAWPSMQREVLERAGMAIDGRRRTSCRGIDLAVPNHE
jgi:8-oxo-dGTP diphosphatase